MSLWSRGCSCKITWQNKIIISPLPESAYSQQTWQDDNLLWWAPLYKVKWPFDHPFYVDLRNQVRNYNHYISTIRGSMVVKLGRIVSYLDGFLPKILMNVWELDLVRSRDNPKSLYSHYHSTYDHQIWQYGNLTWRASAFKSK